MILSTIRAQVLSLDGPITPERIANLLGNGSSFYARRSASDLINSLRNDRLLIKRGGMLYATNQAADVLPQVQLRPEPLPPTLATTDNVQLTKSKYGTVVKFKPSLGLPVTKTLATVYIDAPATVSLRLFNGTWLESVAIPQIIPTVVEAWNAAKQQAYEHECNRVRMLNQRAMQRPRHKVHPPQPA